MGGSSNEQATQQGGWAPGVQGYMSGALPALQSLLMPGGQFQQLPSSALSQVAPFSPMQQQALGQIGQVAGQFTPTTGAGQTLLTDTISGKYLDPSTNPYLQSTYNQAAKSLTDQYALGTAPAQMAAAQRAGAMGGSAYNQMANLGQYGLGQNLANLATNIYGGNYATERNAQLQSLSQMPTVMNAMLAGPQALFGAGAQQQAQQQRGMDVATQNAMAQLQYPTYAAQQYANIGSTLAGPSQTQTTTQKPAGSWWK